MDEALAHVEELGVRSDRVDGFHDPGERGIEAFGVFGEPPPEEEHADKNYCGKRQIRRGRHEKRAEERHGDGKRDECEMKHDGLRQFRGKCAAPEEHARDEEDIEERKRRPRRCDRADVLADEKPSARDRLCEKRVDRARLEFRRKEPLPRTERDEEREAPDEKERHLVEVARRARGAKRRRHRKRHHERKAKQQEREYIIAPPQLEERELNERAHLPEEKFHFASSRVLRKSRSRLAAPSPARSLTGPW